MISDFSAYLRDIEDRKYGFKAISQDLERLTKQQYFLALKCVLQHNGWERPCSLDIQDINFDHLTQYNSFCLIKLVMENNNKIFHEIFSRVALPKLNRSQYLEVALSIAGNTRNDLYFVDSSKLTQRQYLRVCLEVIRRDACNFKFINRSKLTYSQYEKVGIMAVKTKYTQTVYPVCMILNYSHENRCRIAENASYLRGLRNLYSTSTYFKNHREAVAGSDGPLELTFALLMRSYRSKKIKHLTAMMD